MSKKVEQIRQALEEVRTRNGGKLTKYLVFSAARSPGKVSKENYAVLHGLFEWDVKKAAMKHWLERAEEIIVRYVTVVVTTRSHRIVAPMYVRDPKADSNQSSFVSVDDPETSRDDAENIVASELDRCRDIVDRARRVAGVLDSTHPGMSELLEDGLRELIAKSRPPRKDVSAGDENRVGA